MKLGPSAGGLDKAAMLAAGFTMERRKSLDEWPLLELLGEIHEKLDDTNARFGSINNGFCLWCSSMVYDGKEGIIHDLDCIIRKIRRVINE